MDEILKQWEISMSKHIIDQKRSTTGTSRAEWFSKIDAAKRPSRQAKLLQRRPQTTNPEARAKRFIEMERCGEIRG